MAWTVTRLLALFALILTLLVLWAQTRAARRTIAAQAVATDSVRERNKKLEAELRRSGVSEPRARRRRSRTRRCAPRPH